MAKYMWDTLHYETSFFTQAFSEPLKCCDSLLRSQRVLLPQTLEITKFTHRAGNACWIMLGPHSIHTGRPEVYRVEGTRATASRMTPLCKLEKRNPLKHFQDLPGGAVVKNPPANTGDMGSSPGPGRSHML